MYGEMPIFPSTLRYLVLNYYNDVSTFNRFSGALTLSQPVSTLQIYNNLINDIIVLNGVPLAANICDVRNNPLLNSPHPHIWANCQMDGIYSLLPILTTSTSTNTKGFSTRTSKSVSVTISFPTSLLTKYLNTKSLSTAASSAVKTRMVETLSSTAISSEIRIPENIQSLITLHSTDRVLVPSDIKTSGTIFLDTIYSVAQQLTPSSIETPSLNPQSTADDTIQLGYLFGAIGAFVGLCIVILIASKIVKHPKLHSKYGRKNSFGTLNTIATKGTV